MGMDYPSDQTGFVYTNYIKATPDRIWQGLTDPTLTKRYWRHPAAGGKTLPSDWKKGSTWDLVHEDVGLVVLRHGVTVHDRGGGGGLANANLGNKAGSIDRLTFVRQQALE